MLWSVVCTVTLFQKRAMDDPWNEPCSCRVRVKNRVTMNELRYIELDSRLDTFGVKRIHATYVDVHVER